MAETETKPDAKAEATAEPKEAPAYVPKLRKDYDERIAQAILHWAGRAERPADFRF